MDARPQMLIVEDEPALAGVVASYFDRAGFATDTCADGLEAVERARRSDPTVIVLDLGLPGADGIEVCRRIRTFSDAYIVMLTARADEVDVLVGLSVGADDYVTKPFRARELVARVQAMLRRPRAAAPAAAAVRRFGALEVDPAARVVRLSGTELELTPIEFDLLATLSAKPRQAISRRALIEEIWGDSWVGDEHLVDVHVANLRRKLSDVAGSGRYIVTVRGVGYRMGAG